MNCYTRCCPSEWPISCEMARRSRQVSQWELISGIIAANQITANSVSKLQSFHSVCVAMVTEKHEAVSILFSDIVTFTVIASAVQPVDVVNMLNALYSRFDKLCSSHGVYKVRVSSSL